MWRLLNERFGIYFVIWTEIVVRVFRVLVCCFVQNHARHEDEDIDVNSCEQLRSILVYVFTNLQQSNTLTLTTTTINGGSFNVIAALV